MEQLVKEIVQAMQQELSEEQLVQLQNVLYIKMHDYEVKRIERNVVVYDDSGMRILNLFLSTKKVEGCSQKTINYYYQTLHMLIENVAKEIKEVTTNDLRYYLARYKQERGVSNTTLDNMRRVFFEFFWLAGG